MTSGQPPPPTPILQKAAAERWLSTAPGPPASTAAIQRPAWDGRGPDRVDTTVLEVQQAALDTALDGPAAHSEVQQLPAGDDAVLGQRQPCHSPVHATPFTFGTSWVLNVNHVCHALTIARPGARLGA